MATDGFVGPFNLESKYAGRRVGGAAVEELEQRTPSQNCWPKPRRPRGAEDLRTEKVSRRRSARGRMLMTDAGGSDASCGWWEFELL